MKVTGDLRKVGYAALLLLFCALLLNNRQPNRAHEQNKTTEKGYFLSIAHHLSGLMVDDDHSNPADNEEDEDEDDDEDGVESLSSKSYQEFTGSASYPVQQDRLFCDPHGELISPPPKI